MSFVFEEITTAEAKERYATTRDTMLAQVCRRIVSAMTKSDGSLVEATPTMALAQLESMDADFSDWQTRQRDKRAEGNEVQVIDLNGITRKVNADTDKHGVRAIRRDGGTKVLFVADALWSPEDTDSTE